MSGFSLIIHLQSPSLFPGKLKRHKNLQTNRIPEIAHEDNGKAPVGTLNTDLIQYSLHLFLEIFTTNQSHVDDEKFCCSSGVTLRCGLTT